MWAVVARLQSADLFSRLKSLSWTPTLLSREYCQTEVTATRKFLIQLQASPLTFACVFRVSGLSLAKGELAGGELSCGGFRLANVVLDEQHILLVRIQSFHF